MAEPLPETPPSKQPNELVRWVLDSPDRERQAERLRVVGKLFGASREVMTFFNQLSASPNGHRLALEFIARIPLPVPTGLIILAAQLLQVRDAPLNLRLATAAKLISTMPDRPESIGPIVRTLTAELGKTRSLERLVQLQSRVEKCATLDKMVADAEASTKLKCPKCNARLTRPAFIQHLWKKHKLVYEHGAARDPGPLVEKAVAAYAENQDNRSLERVYTRTAHFYPDAQPLQIHQAIVTRLGPGHPEAQPLCQKAAETSLGVCPTCYTAIAPSLPELLPPLALSRGRLVGEGYFLQASGPRVEIAYPDGTTETQRDANARAGSREYACQVGAWVAGIGFLTAAAIPRTFTKPIVPALLGSGLALVAYAALRMRPRKVPNPEDRAIDAAWNEVASRVGRSPRAIRFLTRLCRSSLGVGSPDERSKAVWELVEHAAVLAEKGASQTQLFATVRVLQAHDSSRIGKEWLNQLLAIFEPFLRREVSPVFAEAAAETVLNADIFSDRDAALLRILLAGSAFELGYTPTGLDALATMFPQFGRLLAGNREWFELLHEVWRQRNTRPWVSNIGPAKTVFELAKRGGNAKTLLAFPDVLLVAEFDSPYDQELGDLVVSRRGLTLGEFTISEVDAELANETTRKGADVFVFGQHRIAVQRAIPVKVLRTIRGWLRFREERLIPVMERPADTVPAHVRAIRDSILTACPVCQTRSLTKIGELGST